MDLRIDPVFKDYLGPLDAESRQALGESLRAEGCRDALVVWPQDDGGAILLDGHNRHEICARLGITCHTVPCPESVTDRESATAWIVQNQRARRNLTADQLRYLCGKVYQNEKSLHGGTGANQHTAQSGQNVHSAESGKTAERIAREFGVNEKTVRRNAEFARDVDTAAVEHGPEAKANILAGRARVTDYVPARISPDEREEMERSAQASMRWRDDAPVAEARPLPWAPPLVDDVDPDDLPKDASASGTAVFVKLCDVYREVARLLQFPPVDERSKPIIRKQGRLLVETVEKLLASLS